MPAFNHNAHTHNLPWGYRYCPNCSSSFQVRPESVRFFARYEGDAILFMLCGSCAKKYDQMSQKHRQIVQDDCFESIQNSDSLSEMWACTTYLAINMNFGDYAAAVEHGIHGMDRTSYEALIRADDGCMFVNGVPIPWQRLPKKEALQRAVDAQSTKLNKDIQND